METIKEEKMWELLKKIAKAGWKPYGKGIDELTEEEKNIRLITSRNSGLWQFVCENGMVKERNTRRENHNINSGAFRIYWKSDYEYRLIQSALKNESELEDFLLNSIKLD